MYEIKKVTLTHNETGYKLDLGSLGEENNELFLCKIYKPDGSQSFWLMTDKMITGMSLEVADQRWNFGSKNVVHHKIGSGVHLNDTHIGLMTHAYKWCVTTADVIDERVWRENGVFACRGAQQVQMKPALQRLVRINPQLAALGVVAP